MKERRKRPRVNPTFDKDESYRASSRRHEQLDCKIAQDTTPSIVPSPPFSANFCSFLKFWINEPRDQNGSKRSPVRSGGPCMVSSAPSPRQPVLTTDILSFFSRCTHNISATKKRERLMRISPSPNMGSSFLKSKSCVAMDNSRLRDPWWYATDKRKRKIEREGEGDWLTFFNFTIYQKSCSTTFFCV